MKASEIRIGKVYIAVICKTEQAVRVDKIRSLGRRSGSTRNYPEMFRYGVTVVDSGAKTVLNSPRAFKRPAPNAGYEIREGQRGVAVQGLYGLAIFPFSFFISFNHEDYLARERAKAERGDVGAEAYLIARDELIERGLIEG